MEVAMAILLQALPFDFDALEPYMSAETLNIHYTKHHQRYVDKLNELIEETQYAKLSLEQIILKSAKMPESITDKKIFNNASQNWNHNFFWNSICEAYDQKPSKALAAILKKSFGGKDEFIEEFSAKAADLFGSGWTWLVKNKDHSLEIFNGSNAESPLVDGKIPLLVCDVWEHAYYLDYKNERKTYIQKFWQVVDWEFVEKCLSESETGKTRKKSVSAAHSAR